MTCDELDDFRDREDVRAGAPLPQAASDHLRDCAACRDLQQALDSPDYPPEVPAEVKLRIKKSIVAGLKPVTPLHSNGTLLALFLLLCVANVAVGAASLGVAGWQRMAVWQAAVAFPLLTAAMIAMAKVVIRHMVPGWRLMFSSRAVIIGVCAALLTGTLLLFPYSWEAEFVAKGLPCWERGVLSALFAGALFALVVRRGAWLNPTAQGAATGLLAGLVGFAVLEISCPILDRGHQGVWHFGSVLTAVFLGGMLAMIGKLFDKSPRSAVPPAP